MRWTCGLIPSWAKDAKGVYSMINARVEGAATKRTFSGPYASCHCLLLADGWYEWRVMPPNTVGNLRTDASTF